MSLQLVTTEPTPVLAPIWTLADRIRKTRESVGWTQQEFGDVIGVSRRTVMLWESGKRSPRPSTVLFIALRCRVPIWWIFDEDPESDLNRDWSDSSYFPADRMPARSRCFPRLTLAVAA